MSPRKTKLPESSQQTGDTTQGSANILVSEKSLKKFEQYLKREKSDRNIKQQKTSQNR